MANIQSGGSFSFERLQAEKIKGMCNYSNSDLTISSMANIPDQTTFARDVTVTTNTTGANGDTVRNIFCRNFTINSSINFNLDGVSNNTNSNEGYVRGLGDIDRTYSNALVATTPSSEAVEEVIMWDLHYWFTNWNMVEVGEMDTTGVGSGIDTFYPGSFPNVGNGLDFDNTTDNYHQRRVKLIGPPCPGAQNAGNDGGGALRIFCSGDFTNNGTIAAKPASTGGAGTVSIIAFGDVDEGTIDFAGATGGAAGTSGYGIVLYGGDITTGTITADGTPSGVGKFTRQKFVLEGL